MPFSYRQPSSSKWLVAAPTIVLCAILCPSMFAQTTSGLERVSASRTFGFPAWYQDKTGLTLEFCDPKNKAELDGAWCVLTAGDTQAPEVFGPGTFMDEHFYFAADASMPMGNTTATLVLHLEAAFAQEEIIDSDQIVFARVRVRINNLPRSGTYKIYYPYGTLVFPNQVAGERLFSTADVGIDCPKGNFECALSGKIGPFLLPSVSPGDPVSLPAIDGPVAGKKYIADPTRVGPVTGSPLGQNFFRVTFVEGATETVLAETTNFSLAGRLFSGTIPGRVNVSRASYAQDNSAKKLDVFVNAFPTVQGRIPPAAKPTEVTPVLAYYLGPCDVDPSTKDLVQPSGGQMSAPLIGSGHDFWGQSKPLGAPPSAVCVEDKSARDSAGRIVPAYYQSAVTDEVTVTSATYDPSTRTLRVAATSSDLTTNSDAPVKLTLGQFGKDLDNGSVTITGLTSPPARVIVSSTRGGTDIAKVITAYSTGAPPISDSPAPLRADDITTSTEENVAALITPLNPSNATVTVASAGRLGTVTTDGTSVTYSPNSNISGTDSFTYTLNTPADASANVPAVVSNVATVTITIKAAANHLPVAVNDTATAPLDTATRINVLANDTDLDGQADLVGVVNVAQVSGPEPAVLSWAGGFINITAKTPGTYVISYKAQDKASATTGLASNTATLTVTVASAKETLSGVTAEYRNDQRRWNVTGASNVSAGQVIKITYANGTAKGTEIGTAVVSGTGTWALDVRDVTGLLNPTTISNVPGGSRPTQVTATSELGGTATVTFRSR
jgi:hypothetical protein